MLRIGYVIWFVPYLVNMCFHIQCYLHEVGFENKELELHYQWRLCMPSASHEFLKLYHLNKVSQFNYYI